LPNKQLIRQLNALIPKHTTFIETIMEDIVDVLVIQAEVIMDIRRDGMKETEK
jgi:hypothetical protein